MDLFRSFWTKLTALEREQVPAAVKLSMLAYIMSQALSKPSCAARGATAFMIIARATPYRTVGSASSSLPVNIVRSEEHTSELQSLMRTQYDVFCLKKTTTTI